MEKITEKKNAIAASIMAAALLGTAVPVAVSPAQAFAEDTSAGQTQTTEESGNSNTDSGAPSSSDASGSTSGKEGEGSSDASGKDSSQEGENKEGENKEGEKSGESKADPSAAAAMKALKDDFTIPPATDATAFWEDIEAKAKELAGEKDELTEETASQLVEFTAASIKAENQKAADLAEQQFQKIYDDALAKGATTTVKLDDIIAAAKQYINISDEQASAAKEQLQSILNTDKDEVVVTDLAGKIPDLKALALSIANEPLGAQTAKAEADLKFLITGKEDSKVAANLGALVRTYEGSELLKMGTYVDFDIDYSSEATGSHFVTWKVPDELFAEGFTIVNYGMLAPEVTVADANSQDAKVPEIMISDDGRTVSFQIPESDGTTRSAGNVDLALHSDKITTTSGLDMADFVKTVDETGKAFKYLVQPTVSDAIDPDAKTATKVGFRDAKKTFTITYDTNGGLPLSPDTIENADVVKVGNKKFLQPVKQNAKFEGWYMDPDWTTPLDLFTMDEIKDITVYAKWTETPQPEPTPTPTPTPQPAPQPAQTQTISKTADSSAPVAAVGLAGVIAAAAVAVRRRFRR